MSTMFKFYNSTADTWHMFDVLSDRKPKFEISYDDHTLLSKLGEVINHTNSFSIVPIHDGVPNFALALELGEYTNNDIELILNYMKNS